MLEVDDIPRGNHMAAALLQSGHVKIFRGQEQYTEAEAANLGLYLLALTWPDALSAVALQHLRGTPTR